MQSDYHAFYWAGIAVTAFKFGIKLQRLSIGDKDGLHGEAELEPVTEWCDLDVGMNSFKASAVEDYATTLLAGSAASFIRAQDERHHLKRSLGDAGLKMKFERQVWECVRREPDRAVALICGSLGSFDDGDVEATTQRLLERAVRTLRQPKQNQQLKRLAQKLLRVKLMTDRDINQFFGVKL